MIHIQKPLSFILLNRAIYYHDTPFSIMRWLRKCVWIQRMLRPYALQYWEFKLSFERINSIQWSFNYKFHNEFYLLLPGPINSINGWIYLLNHNSGRNVTILSTIFIIRNNKTMSPFYLDASVIYTQQLEFWGKYQR